MMLSSVLKLKHNLYLEETHYILCINPVTLIIEQTVSNLVPVNTLRTGSFKLFKPQFPGFKQF